MPKSLVSFVSLSLIFVWLAGCATPVNQVPNSAKNQIMAANDPQITASYADIPIADDDVLIVSDSLLLNTGEQWTGRAVFRTKMDIKTAFNYFHKHMPTYGWIGITFVQSNIAVMTFEKANRIATIQVEERAVSGSRLSITVSPRETTVNNVKDSRASYNQ
jgi:hypothetical protein